MIHIFLNAKLPKKVASVEQHHLHLGYNNCIESIQWPTIWKTGEWTPAFKNKDREEEKKYRRITPLICADNIFEQILSKKVTSHYDPTLYNRMTACRSQHSCEKTLFPFVGDWKLAVDK